jgi:hypothetical protein
MNRVINQVLAFFSTLPLTYPEPFPLASTSLSLPERKGI